MASFIFVARFSFVTAVIGFLFSLSFLDITELAAARSKFYATYDFTSLSLNGIMLIDNEKLRSLNTSEKFKYLTGTLDNIYGNTKNRISFAIELAGDLPEVIRTLLLVLSIKDATICCAQGQNIYVEKRGADPPRCNQT